MSDHHQYCTGGFDPDDIVISGVSGRFPMCGSVGDLCEALLSKKNLLEQNNVRFKKGAAGLTFSSSGTLDDLNKFDAEFFGFTAGSAYMMDPAQRLLFEASYEAMADSGYDPSKELRGKNIGIYTAVTGEDAKELMIDYDFDKRAVPGLLRSMFANRCSYIFDFHGPSSTIDTACSSSLTALYSAFHDLHDGRVDAALVNSVQLCLRPEMSQFYVKSGIVSPTATCDPFEARANGIVRTEAACALFLQKASVARRAYATILHIKHVAAGYVPEGVYVPSFEQETKLFRDVMKEAGVTTDDIEFVEAHGTGTPVGDPIELSSIEAAFCTGRTKPLYMGSVKNNLGHSEAAAGHSGVIKVILAFETGIIAPQRDFVTPNPNCKAIIEDRIRMVTDPMPLMSPYVPVSSFGFGGSLVHTILKRNPIEYKDETRDGDLPRLVLYPATTEAAVQFLLDYVKDHKELRNEFFALLNKLSFTPVLQKPFRGYAVFQNEPPVMHIQNSLREKREVWFVMTGMGCQWPGMGLEMMKIGVFAESMKKSAALLKPFDIDLFEFLREDSKAMLTNRSIIPAFVSIAAIQIALVDVLKALEIHPDGIVGHSVGELLCAYVDGCCTAEETILSAYWRGKSVETASILEGGMAAIGLTWEEAVRRCPKDVYPACHNSEDLVTISGLKDPIEKFVAQLQKENVFARNVNAHGYPFHCKHILPAGEILRTNLSKIITEPKPRTDRWISTSYPEEEWQTEACKMVGTEYFVHNLLSVVHFENALKRIPSDAITIEIGPHFLLQSILKRSIGSGAFHIGLMKRNNNNNIGFFLESLGKLYMEGLDPKIENLYPSVNFPVPRGTPMISDLLKWNHSQSWHVAKWKPSSNAYDHRFRLDSRDSYLLDHFIDGRSLFPATGYIFMAWQGLAKKMGRLPEEIDIVIEDFKIHRPTILTPSAFFAFKVVIFDGSGSFEIMNDNSLVASGRAHMLDNINFFMPDPITGEDSSISVSGEEIYNKLKLCGYEYGPAFRRLVEININGTEGFVEWNDWISFMDALLLFYMFNGDRTNFVLPTGALSFKISPRILQRSVEECQNKNLPGLPVKFYASSKICRTMGIEIQQLKVDVAQQHTKLDDCVLEEYKFVPYFHKYTSLDQEKKLKKYMTACNKVIEKIEKNLKVDLNRAKFAHNGNIEFHIDENARELEKDQKLLYFLRQIEEVGKLQDKEQRKELFVDFLTEIGKDVSNTLLVNEHCLRIMFDIVSENSFRKLSVLEVNRNFPTTLPTIVEVVEKFSTVKFKSKILACQNKVDIDNNVLNEKNIQFISYDSLQSLTKDKNQGVVISSFCTGTEQEAQQLIRVLASAVEEKGFVLLFHKNFLFPPENLIATLVGETVSVVPQSTIEKIFEAEKLVIVSKVSDNFYTNLYLLRRISPVEQSKIINVSYNTKWLDELKSRVTDSSDSTWLLSEDCPSSGLIGMVNCLCNEPGGHKIRCVFIPDRSRSKRLPPFSFEHSFYKDLLKKDLVMNVFKDESWGSFRHLRIKKEAQASDVDYSYANIKKYGDLSSFHWQESAVKYMDIPDENLVHIYYSALNFKDVMLATGKISATTDLAISGSDNCVLGLEYAGRTTKGQRVAGICRSRGIATATQILPAFSFPVPDDWTMEEAATVPVVYCTCYYAMIVRGQLQPGESVLIHSGAGGIGLAAINIALSMNCEIFVTVGTPEKRAYLLETFPSLKEENIGNSRNTSFELMIKERTKGRGVDLVLNSLADDKFYASVRCVAKQGQFVEIGKYDLSLDHKIGLNFFLNDITFHGVFLDQIMDADNGIVRRAKLLRKLMLEGIQNGVVKPLKRTVFQRHEVERAFRYMGAGTHIGKVLIKIRDEEREKLAFPRILHLSAIPVTYFYGHKVYIVIGGLGGFGIEVSKWILNKGARNLVLTSRFGARTPYHHLCLKRWKDSGYNVVVSTINASIHGEAEKLLREAAEMGPVGGIFNSAVVLHDAFLENQNLKHFEEVCAPKADVTRHLDDLSRTLCPQLDHFVCFSSISCGRGNAGQMNYGYANSVMERICEQRHVEGLPGLAIQWGIIGEVGVVHRNMGDDAMIAGVGAQRVKSCLDILDLSCQLRHPVVSSYVIKDSMRKKEDQGDVLQQLAKIFGLKDVSEFNSIRSFQEMGVDSMIGIEIKQLLEASCDTTFTTKELQEMRIDDVKMLLSQAAAKKQGKPESTALVSTANIRLPKSFVHACPIQPLNNVKVGYPVFIVDLDCSDLSQLRVLGAAIGLPSFGMLWSKESPTSSTESLATWYLERLKNITREEIHLIAYSTSSALTLEMALQSQNHGITVRSLTVLNDSGLLSKVANKEDSTKSSEEDILIEFVENYIPLGKNKLKSHMSKAHSLAQQIRTIVELFTKNSSEVVNKDDLVEIIHLHVRKIRLFEQYKPQSKLQQDLLIIQDSSKLLANDVAELQMLLSGVCSGKIFIQRIPSIETFTDDSVKRIMSVLKSVF